MEQTINRLKDYLTAYSLNNGKNNTRLPFVRFYRFDEKNIRLPDTSAPYLYLIVNGMLRLHTGKRHGTASLPE